MKAVDMFDLMFLVLTGFVVWSMLSILLTGCVILVPICLGWWRLVQLLSGMLVVGFICLWIMALLRIPTGLPLPTRPRAGVVVWPVMALWPALAGFLVSHYRQALPAPTDPSD